MRHKFLSIILMSLLCAPVVGAQGPATDSKHSIKAEADFSLGNAYSTTTDLKGIDVDKSSAKAFGVTYRYRFWQNGKFALGANAGLAFSTGSLTMTADKLSFDYTAGADADMDGDTYQRYTTMQGMKQKLSVSELGIPVYVDAEYKFAEHFSAYATLGLGFRFSTSASAKVTDGTCDTYGIYPKYDNLKIDDEWINDFGEYSLAGVSVEKPHQHAFVPDLRIGAGLRADVYGPIAVECGVNFCQGLCSRLKSGPFETGSITTASAPMTYRVDNGRTLKSLSSTLSKSTISVLSLHIGIILRINP